jgi:hypothetical protein
MGNHLKIIFSCSYHTAKLNKPFSDLPELLILTKRYSVDILPEYNNRAACKEYIHNISAIFKYSHRRQ